MTHNDVHPRCRNKAKKLPEELSPTSIIIVMFNEELSVILRTIVSILLNTPMESVKEVIIVDDRSNKGVISILTDPYS